MKIPGFYKVPFRDVYANTRIGWVEACFTCLWATFLYRTGLRKHQIIGGPTMKVTR